MGKATAQPLDLRRIRLLLRPLRTTLAAYSNAIVYENSRGGNTVIRATTWRGTLNWSGKGGSKSRAEKDCSWAQTGDSTITRKPSTVTYGKSSQVPTPPTNLGLKNTSQDELRRILLLTKPGISQDLLTRTLNVFQAYKNILIVVYGPPPTKSTPRMTEFSTLQEIAARVLGFEIEEAVKSELHEGERDDESTGEEESDVYALAEEFFVAAPVSSWR